MEFKEIMHNKINYNEQIITRIINITHKYLLLTKLSSFLGSQIPSCTSLILISVLTDGL